MEQAKVDTATSAVNTHIAPEGLLADAAAHHRALRTALSDAKGTVVIASDFLDHTTMER